MALSAAYTLFGNPFYYGVFRHKGTLYPGKHLAMIAPEEFHAVQARLRKRTSPRPKHHAFPYTGLLRCGTCGAAVTAEHKVNRFASRYVYYHCTHRRPGIRCVERSVEGKVLEAAFRAVLETVTLAPALLHWVESTVSSQEDTTREEAEAIPVSLRKRIRVAKGELEELLHLRLRGFLTDEQFLGKRRALEEELTGLDARLDAAVQEPRSEGQAAQSNRHTLAFAIEEVFTCATDEDKRAILRTVGTQFTVTGKQVFVRLHPVFTYTHPTPVCSSTQPTFLL